MSERGLSAEQALLGSMLQDERILPDVIHTVREEDFALDVDRLIFAAMRDMYIHGKPIDGVTVRARIGQDYSDYLLQLLEVTPKNLRLRKSILDHSLRMKNVMKNR